MEGVGGQASLNKLSPGEINEGTEIINDVAKRVLRKCCSL